MTRGDNRKAERRRPSASSDVDVKIAWLYHVENLTQEEIGRKLNISRVKVMRSLATSVAKSVVVTTVNASTTEQVALERKLEIHWGLDSAIVVPDPSESQNLENLIGHAVAQYVDDQMQDGMTLAIGGGATLHASLAYMARRSLTDASVIGLVGSLPHSRWINPSIVAAKVAERLNAVSYQINAPVVVDDPLLRDRLWAQPSLRDVGRRAAAADIAILTAGEIAGSATVFRYEIVSPNLVSKLLESGAAANVLCQFIDAQGRLIGHELNKRIMAIDLATVARLPHVVLAAGGDHKVDAILAAIKAIRANVLITNVSTAKQMLARQTTQNERLS